VDYIDFRADGRAELNIRGAITTEDGKIESAVDLDAHRADADLDELDLGEDIPEAV
jgi:hypothetical protein